MWHFSDNPRTAITEVEVFCGSILNKRGSQTRQQRDLSSHLREEMDRVLSWIVGLIRQRGTADGRNGGGGREDGDTQSVASGVGSAVGDAGGRKEVVQLCWACMVVGCVTDASTAPESYHGDGDLRSFRVVAAAGDGSPAEEPAFVTAPRLGHGLGQQLARLGLS